MGSPKKLMIWAVGTMILTLIHHVFGAVIYEDSFRFHVAVFAIPVIVAILASYVGVVKIRIIVWRKICLVFFLAFSFLFPVAAIGFYEGGYNHVLKNIFYFGGVSTRILDQMYPSIYELPDNLVFELTGIAQFFTGIMAAIELRRLFLSRSFTVLNKPLRQERQ